MIKLTKLCKNILDIIFPQSKLHQKIHSLSHEDLSKKLDIKERHDVVYLFQYKDPLIRQMIWLLKYKGNLHVAKLFASILYDYLMEEISDEVIFSENTKIVIVPLPLSKKRKRERGFNQIILVTRELQKLGKFSIKTDILIRTKHTKPQTSLSKKEDRTTNIKDVFEVKNKKNIENTYVILIDDVLTTGSTLKEAKKTLINAGIHKVSCITIAH